MKKEQTDEVSRGLEELRSHLRKIDRIEREIAKCNEDEAAMGKRRQELEGASYRDEKSIQEQVVLTRRLEMCVAAKVKAEGQLDEAKAALRPILEVRIPQARRLLTEIRQRQLATVTAVIRPFCSSDRAAEQVALQTCVARDAQRSVGLFAMFGPSDVAPRIARRVVAVLEEASKDGGDLLKFLTPSAATAAEANAG